MTKTMTVQGVEITDAQQDAAKKVIARDRFTYSEVAGALIQAGVKNEDYVPERAADRILQRHRRAKLIEPAAGRGCWKRA